MAQPIVFYDIPIKDRTNPTPWSPNAWKVRYTLNLKGLKYKTEWLEYPDIEPTAKGLGGAPTDKKPDGSDFYTLPMIYDPNTKAVITNSAAIAKYLDNAYPDTPRVFPAGTDAFQAAFLETAWANVGIHVFMLVILDTANHMFPRSHAYFRATREAKFGNKLENLATEDEWAAVEAGLARWKGYLEANGEGGDLLFMGAQGTVTYSDLQIAALFVWAKTVWGENSERWKRLTALQGGKWAKFYAQFAKFEQAAQ
ncbi:glutathione S-transferase [Phanerochaete sordida]|uniref:Glutathione S-transferase n=1 Tax=Phanerochaete sordida TaxID=48140 RepID=A0A9P3LPX5_9APHY|nr:glutathione S-transferase [Phanerochaete sordida]